jgi:hypothetical protein
MSSNGRTAVSEAAYCGSNPHAATKFQNSRHKAAFVFSGDFMSATTYAMYSQNSSQSGTTVAGAFPQVNGYAQDLDLLQIVSKKGLSPLAVVDYLGNVITGLVLTQVTVSGASTVYTGTITGGGTNNYAGRKLYIKGFAQAGNNGEFVIVSNDTTTITVTTSTQVNETHAGTALPYTVGTRVGRFATDFGVGDTYTTAELFANTFTNPSLQDILQVINAGGNIHYYLDYLGVAHGS